MNRLPFFLLLALLLGSTGCPPSTGPDTTGDDDATPTDTPATVSIPDPGTAMDDWGFSVIDPCCGTPETAFPVGTVTMDAGYIQGNFDTGLAFFYVFRTAANLTTFTFPMYFEEVHLHDGDGLVFGDLITPSASTDFSVTWDVQGDHVYALELRSEFEGFF